MSRSRFMRSKFAIGPNNSSATQVGNLEQALESQAAGRHTAGGSEAVPAPAGSAQHENSRGDGRHAGLIEDEQHVIAGQHDIGIGCRQGDRKHLADLGKAELQESLIRVERMRHRTRAYERHAADRVNTPHGRRELLIEVQLQQTGSIDDRSDGQPAVRMNHRDRADNRFPRSGSLPAPARRRPR